MNFDDIVRYLKLQKIEFINNNGSTSKRISICGKFLTKNLLALVGITLIFTIILACFTSSDIYKPSYFFISFVCLWVLGFIRYKTLRKTTVKEVESLDIYAREKPSNLKPAHVRMLLNDGLIDELSVAATIMDLIDNDYLKIENFEKKENFFNRNVDMTISKTNKNDSDLLLFERFLIEWFIDICGDGKKITSEKLKLELKEAKKMIPNDKFTEFKGLVILSFPFEVFYDNHIDGKINSKINFMGITMGLLFLMPICPLIIYLFFYSIIRMISNYYLLNVNGQIEKSKWLLLKKYLKDFSTIKDESVESVIIWEYYLTYSIVLNVNEAAKNEIMDLFWENINSGEIFEDSYDPKKDYDAIISKTIKSERKKYNFKQQKS